MKIHYFQRYHQSENVATANTMLLLSRLYSYSPDKFFQFLKDTVFSDGFEPGIEFTIQKKGVKSIPDAVIHQDSFKIVVETKRTDWFYDGQLIRHLQSFGNESLQVLMTLAAEPMDKDKQDSFNKKLAEYNIKNNSHIYHYNSTFEMIAQGISDVLDERDYDMQDILDDFYDYCYSSHLISESWKYMRVQLAGRTIKFNSQFNVYYNDAERGFSEHDFLGLYHQKSVQFIGKIIAEATAQIDKNGTLNVKTVRGVIGEEQKKLILKAIDDGRKNRGYSMNNNLRYFFVDKFCKTNFKKETPHAPRGSRMFNLSKIIGEDITRMTTDEIADKLRNITWQ